MEATNLIVSQRQTWTVHDAVGFFNFRAYVACESSCGVSLARPSAMASTDGTRLSPSFARLLFKPGRWSRWDRLHELLGASLALRPEP